MMVMGARLIESRSVRTLEYVESQIKSRQAWGAISEPGRATLMRITVTAGGGSGFSRKP